MTWGNVLNALQKLSPLELEEEAQAYLDNEDLFVPIIEFNESNLSLRVEDEIFRM